MSQSTLIVGALFAAWFVWIVLRGELGMYLGVFGLGASSGRGAPGVAGGPGSSPGAAGNIIGSIGEFGTQFIGNAPGSFGGDATGLDLSGIKFGAPEGTADTISGIIDFGGGSDK